MSGKTVTKKVRLDADLAARLARLARRRASTESEVLRRGIELAERETRREAALARLVADAEWDRARGRRGPSPRPRGRP